MNIHWSKEYLPFRESLIEINMVVAYRDRTTQDITNCTAYYLQGIRNGVLRNYPTALQKYHRTYCNAIPDIIDYFVKAFNSRCVHDAALIVPPSSRYDARPYAKALLKVGIASIDLSDNVQRIDPSFRAGEAVSFQDICSSIKVIKEPLNEPYDSLVVVDDVLSSGRSVAAVVLALQESGFISESTEIFVAAVLSVKRKVQVEPASEQETA
jgi:hypothetical protein